MEAQEERRSSDNGNEDSIEEHRESVEEGLRKKLEAVELGDGDAKVLRFMDSMEEYLTLIDSLSSSLRKGWLELASARHSMGASRINTVLLDLKVHPAATSVYVKEQDDSLAGQPNFTLCKWVSSESQKGSEEEESFREKISSSQIRYRGNAQLDEKNPSDDGAMLKVDDQVEKERKKSLKVFGALVSPKLRSAQLSFESALEALVEIANIRAAMLSAFNQVQEEQEGTKG